MFCDNDLSLDYQKDFENLLKCTEKDDCEAQYKLGLCYQIVNDEIAFKYYLISAEGNNVDAQLKITSCYYDGLGTIKNEDEALRWFIESEKNKYLFVQNESEIES